MNEFKIKFLLRFSTNRESNQTFTQEHCKGVGRKVANAREKRAEGRKERMNTHIASLHLSSNS